MGPGRQTNVAVDWASFIPFVKVGVNKNKGDKNVDVNVGGSSLVDVKVDKDEVPQAGGKHHKKVVVHAPFVDLDVDGDFPPPPPHPHPHPPKKHHKHPRHPHDDEDKNVSVNVGGQNGGSWWPFVNVNVDSDAKAAPHGKAVGKRCININVPFVNVLLNRGCKPDGDSEAILA
ncbi:hypothetical protein M8J76_006966 [Diaphorina citri]|nr:hypothetical protein M8J76_006966 [Diaphorina citri]